MVARVDVGRCNIDGLGHGKGLQPFPRVGLKSPMRRCRPWFSAALRALHLLSSPLSHLHALFNLQVRNGGKLSFSVVVVAVIVELVPVLAAGALEGGYFADVFDLSAFGGGVSGEGLAVLEGEV